MSSTARGGQRSPADFYETPAWSTYHAVNALSAYCPWLFTQAPTRMPKTFESERPPIRILEPCAGGGAIIRAANAMMQHLYPWLSQSWHAIEPNEQGEKIFSTSVPTTGLALDMPKGDGASSLVFERRDFFARQLEPMTYDLVIMNPPFRFAMEFIEECLKLAPAVACLLRLNFLGGAERNEFFRKWAPGVFVIPNRVSFISPEIKLGATDSIEYAWFVWDRRRTEPPVIRVLPAVPKHLRKPMIEFTLDPSPMEWMNFISGVQDVSQSNERTNP